MKRTSLNSQSNGEMSEAKQPHPWLLKHYEEKRQRTVSLVKAAVDRLLTEKQQVTIEAICRTSSELDPQGRGVKKSAILENPEAHAYYREHSTSYKQSQSHKRQITHSKKAPRPQGHQLRIDPNRKVERVRYRYLQMTKAELVERLLTVEQEYAQVVQQLARLQFQLIEQHPPS
jgi:hypothetical protein